MDYSCEYNRDQRPKMRDRRMDWNLCESESESYSINRGYRLGTEQLVHTTNDKQRGQNTWTLTRIIGLIADTSVAKLERTHRLSLGVGGEVGVAAVEIYKGATSPPVP